MITTKNKVMALALAVASMFAAPSAALTGASLEEAIAEYKEETVEIEAEIAEIEAQLEEVQVAQGPSRWTGNFTDEELKVLNFFQDRGITDRAALATLMGNIKQESKFNPNICEGGARGPYHTCRRGGFGLIQWTTVGRYQGLGRHARSIGGDPTHIDTQLSYLVSEVEWKKVEHIFKQEGHSISTYMGAAKRWLGWGVHGARTSYSHSYYNRLTTTT